MGGGGTAGAGFASASLSALFAGASLSVANASDAGTITATINSPGANALRFGPTEDAHCRRSTRPWRS